MNTLNFIKNNFYLKWYASLWFVLLMIYKCPTKGDFAHTNSTFQACKFLHYDISKTVATDCLCLCHSPLHYVNFLKSFDCSPSPNQPYHTKCRRSKAENIITIRCCLAASSTSFTSFWLYIVNAKIFFKNGWAIADGCWIR